MTQQPAFQQPEPASAGADPRERTLLAALLLSAWGPFATGYAVALNPSATQIADFVRRSAELVALVLAWHTYRVLAGHVGLACEQRARLEKRVRRVTGLVMAVSGAMILAVAVGRLGASKPNGVVWPGLVIAGLGLLTNSWFWRRYLAHARTRRDVVIVTQARLYAAKALTDLGVLLALGAAAALASAQLVRAIDLAGSTVVAIYLFWNGFRTAGRRD